MDEHSDLDKDSPRTLPAQGDARELLVITAGGRLFAVYADEADGVAECSTPTPLPHAPRAVLGVVCVRGRMRTVLDPLALTGANDDDETTTTPRHDAATPRLVVTLRGDEQLALAADTVERAPAPTDDALAPNVSAQPQTTATRATLEHGGQSVSLLDPAAVFDAAMHGAERRRQRGKT